MNSAKLPLALAVLALIVPVHAQAEDEAHRHDRLEIQRLNREAASRFAQRDRRYRREAGQSQAGTNNYTKARAQYQRDMANWRRRVAACNQGERSAC